ncbi:MAG: type VI secretion system baseplate subunit TssG [Paracoccus sp. (in: a-proteobacteria)]|nr:type VI secretion system baseplate subunit TssG [Paracoccus sp. (in: a-proteobacteria)]
MTGEAGFLALLRRLERDGAGRPRIGRSTRLGEEIVDLGQDPRLDFPAGEFHTHEDAGPAGPRLPYRERIRRDGRGRVRLRPQFMGMFGAFGALPLNTTEEVQRWQNEGQDGFIRFADILTARFMQLFFRAWSDSHAISQHDRPEDDRFARYIATISGTGSPAFTNHDDFPDIARLPLVSIFGGRVRSAVRLRQIIGRYFGLNVEVEEHVPSWLLFEPDELHGLGLGGALGQDSYLGNRVQSVSEKICIHLDLPDAARYGAFLPGGDEHRMLTHLIFWYLGRAYDVELALRLPPAQIPAATLGQTVQLGWLAAITPPGDPDAPPVEVARFQIDPETAGPGAKP